MANMNWMGLLSLLVSAAAALVCITFHELSHGYVAYRLGDPTARQMGRLTLNPIKHLDPIGFLMMIFAGVGWAKPVPVDMRYFRNPKRGMAITALAGPVSNFLMAVVTMLICSLVYRLLLPTDSMVLLVVFYFLCNVAILSVGLGLFNLIPISPLDGSKVLFSFLPDRVYYTILRYERHIMFAVIALVFFNALGDLKENGTNWFNFFQLLFGNGLNGILLVIESMVRVVGEPLSFCINGVLQFLCRVTGLPWEALVIGSQILDFLG